MEISAITVRTVMRDAVGVADLNRSSTDPFASTCYSGSSMHAWRWVGAALWLAAIGLCLMPAAAALRSAAPVAAHGAVLVLGLVGAFRPQLAIAALAALTPVATYITAQRGGPATGWSEALVVGSCAGMLTHYAVKSRLRIASAFGDRLVLAAMLLAATAGLSAAMLVATERLALPAQFASRMWSFLTASYLEERVMFKSLHAAAIVVEGMLLLICTAVALNTRESRYTAARMFVAGAATATVLTLLRFFEAAVRSGSPVRTFLTSLRSIRYYAAHGDLNAAGSFLLMALFITVAFTMLGLRQRRLGAAAASTLGIAVLLLGLWCTGSRTALGTAAVVAAAWFVAGRWPRAPRHERLAILGVAAGIIIITAIVLARFSQNQIIVSGVLFMRYEMALVSLRMLATAPVFGVGIGTFYERSADFIRAPEVLLYYSHENAHNNLLQVLGEIGISGAAAFVWVLVEASRRAFLGLRDNPGDTVQSGIVAAGAAFLLTALTGHPLLVPEVAYPFWIALGIACAAAPADRRAAGVVSRSGWAIAIALLLLTIPMRLGQVSARADLEHVSYGTSGWRTSADGVTYKEFRGRGVFFVPSNASVVSITVKSPEGDMRIQVAWNGRPAGVVPVSGTGWQELRLRVPQSDDHRLYQPMELSIVEPAERRNAPVHAGKVVVRTLRAP